MTLTGQLFIGRNRLDDKNTMGVVERRRLKISRRWLSKLSTARFREGWLTSITNNSNVTSISSSCFTCVRGFLTLAGIRIRIFAIPIIAFQWFTVASTRRVILYHHGDDSVWLCCCLHMNILLSFHATWPALRGISAITGALTPVQQDVVGFDSNPIFIFKFDYSWSCLARLIAEPCYCSKGNLVNEKKTTVSFKCVVAKTEHFKHQHNFSFPYNVI